MNRASSVAAAAAALMFLHPAVSRAAAGDAAPGVAPAPAAVVARVGGGTINSTELESYLDSRPPATGLAADEWLRRRLDELVLAEALYREALRLGVDRSPEAARAIRQIVVQFLLEEQIEKPVRARPIAEEELRAFYDNRLAEYDRPEQVRLAEIFFAANAGGDPAARELKRTQAATVLELVRGQQDKRFGFGELVLEHSGTPEGHPRGDTGFFDRAGRPVGIDPALAAAAFGIVKIGQVHDGVVETPAGFHIVMLVGRRDAERREFEKFRGEIETRIRREDRERAQKSFFERVRAESAVAVDEAVFGAIAGKYAKPAGDPGASGRDAAGAGPSDNRFSPPPFPGERR